ncbi:hypothetical protein [Marinobacter salarius]|uniref:hypothetical protein n=1 Tax=Marinobacter salarius TaxID=1420917 RepID=UPI003D9C4E2D
MKRILVAILGVMTFAVAAQEIQWPPLPETGFISGRAAEMQDVQAGNAVFVAAVNGVSIGKSIDISIPQYALHIDQGLKTPVVIVQAESAQGQRIIGARQFDGSELVGTFVEFELLGSEPVR